METAQKNNNNKREHKLKQPKEVYINTLFFFPIHLPLKYTFMTGRAQDLANYIQIYLDLGSPSFRNKAWMMSLGLGGRECIWIPLYWLERQI